MRSEGKDFSKTPKKIKDMFDLIADDYDKLNNLMTFGLHKKIKNDVIKGIELAFDAKILDLCTGTGDLANMLKVKYPKADVIGVDFSKNMLEIARKRYPNIEFIEADCTQLPFEDGSFDLCVISFGLRNIREMEKAAAEIYRVLKKGGIFINLDLGKPKRFLNLVLKPYMYLWVALLGKIFHGDETPYKYLAVSNETFPSQGELVKIFQKIGFLEVKNKNYLFEQIASQVGKK